MSKTNSHKRYHNGAPGEKAVAEPLGDMELTFKDVYQIQQSTLANIASEIVIISDMVEERMTELSSEFRHLVTSSQQQEKTIGEARRLLRPDFMSTERQTSHAVYKLFSDRPEMTGDLKQNSDRMVYAMQFQDQMRQRMQAIAATLNMLGDLSAEGESYSENNNIKEKVTISDDNRRFLHQVIKRCAPKELDQRYIMKMFFGGDRDEEEKAGSGLGVRQDSDATDIEFF
ncbi:hypothetical protein [Paremcibacter congregatus]|uniref:hypothetical protein n=1 Tax=Paremcibacter congregatus TaxID=2043170 RepID=UPI0030EDF6F4|tara:strand:- start:5672 stop:6358 length:687 start_codon:yes stop_codon:yes gene_type:complete